VSLGPFQPAVREWFAASFEAPTEAQTKGWAAIARGESTLLLAPTGSGKTLAAFLWCINRLMFEPAPPPADPKHAPSSKDKPGCRVLYVSPLKALAVDVERNLRAPIAGIAHAATRRGDGYRLPSVLVRTGDTPSSERARFQREPADIVITTPESLYLLLTSNARDAFRHVDTLIIDEIHALVPTKRGAHLALSVERLARLAERPPQRIGLSATQRPLEEVARFLGGTERAARKRPTTPSTKRSQTTKKTSAAGEIHDEFAGSDRRAVYRPVTIVDAGRRKPLQLKIETPVEDMARLSQPIDIPSGPAAQGPVRPSIWTAIYPRLLELVRSHRSTLVFVNSRRIAERLAAALNDLAGEPLVRAHHGSLARPQRTDIEDALKAGQLRGLVATSSLELGIDMGAIDLVVQIEAPPSVASGLQRIGRAGHQVGAVSEGRIFPKYRGDLVACATAARRMHEGLVEATRYPRNPLDVLAQQIVATVAMDRLEEDELFDLVRGAAPFADLDRGVFEGVLDMLAGRYPSDEFAELRPRITWDRVRHTIAARDGAKRVAIANGGTIPDRGLYGVFLVGAPSGSARVGELDEEMVFESRVGETFLLGASSWRIEDITHDRVFVSPAPGEPGKMPFWKGETATRPLEFGRAIGALVRMLRSQPPAAALERLERDHDLDRQAAENLLQYLGDQHEAIGVVPDDRTIVIERCRDELGDWRVCLLSPLGGQVLAPWSMAILARVREETGLEAETLWTDDGLVVRFPDTDDPPDPRLMLPAPDDVEALLLRQLGGTSLFAAKFREAAARALLLPRRRFGGRAPLWQQRKRAADLLAVASKFGSFPMLLESYRECLRDLFDLPALVATLRDVEQRQIRIVTVDSTVPSPFAASLLFGYVANYIYDGDAPLAERRAQALSIDHAQLQALIGDAELREVLDRDAIDEVERELQHLEPTRRFKTVDGLHDLLLRIGDLSESEVAARSADPSQASAASALVEARRAVLLPIAGEPRYVAVEDAGRYRDALGVPMPMGLPASLLEPVRQPLLDLVMRYARTHGPFTVDDVARRFGLAATTIEATLKGAVSAGRLHEGDFRPGGAWREWCEPGVLAQIRRRSLARVRRQVEPVEPATLGRLVTSWQGVTRRRSGLDALLDAIETLQGAPLAASLLEREILPARIEGYTPGDLDTLLAAGEVVWCGVEPLGERDGRVALYLTDALPRLWRPPDDVGAAHEAGASAAASARVRPVVVRSALPDVDSVARDGAQQGAGQRRRGEGLRRGLSRRSPEGAKGDQPNRDASATAPDTALGERELAILEHLHASGASFFGPIHDAVGGGYPRDTVDALWTLVWRGRVTNDALQALRAYVAGPGEGQTRRTRPPAGGAGRPFRSRRQVPSSAEGRWSVMADRVTPASHTERTAALAQQLLSRYGLVTREAAAVESIPGGFSAIYDVLRRLDETGRVRRGFFVGGLAATQFALPPALDLLRSLRQPSEEPESVVLAASDPANPYGAMLKWPTRPADAPAPRGDDAPDAPPSARRMLARSVGSRVVLVDGQLAAYVTRGGRQLLTWLPDVEPDRSRVGRALAARLVEVALSGEGREGGLLVGEIDGIAAPEHPLAPFLVAAGFVRSGLGYQVRRDRRDTASPRSGQRLLTG
jgi:ATP-dependent Lhr-like helicase